MAGYILSTEREKSTTKITVPGKDFIHFDGKIKRFSDKQKLREFSTTKSALTTNVKGTYIVKKYKRRKRSTKTNPKQLRKWQ